MLDKISDITVNISVEDVVNPASFGTPLIYTNTDKIGDLQYKECYDVSDAVEALNNSTLKESMGIYNYSGLTAGTSVTKATINATQATSGSLSVSFLSETYTVEASAKSYGSYSFTKRIKSIETNNGCTISVNGGDKGRSIIAYCIASNSAKTSNLMLADSAGNIVGQQQVSSSDVNAVVFSIPSEGSASYSLYSTSADGGTVHIYGIELVRLGDVARAMQRAVEVAFMQDPKPEKIAILGTSKDDFISNYMYYEWHAVTYLCSAISLTNQEILEYLSSQIEAAPVEKVLFFASTPSMAGNSNYKSVLSRIKGNTRTYVIVEDNESAVKTTSGHTYPFAAVALMVKTAAKEVGSFTYKNQQLKGCYPISNITKGTLNEWHTANINCVVTKACYDVTSEGKTISGEYLDIIDCKDWLIMQIKYQLQQTLIINDKIPYTNQGIDYLASIVVNILNDAYNQGMINTTDDGLPDYTVNFKPRSETKVSDREKRQYVDGKFSFGLAGAIHTVTVNGTILI